VVIKLKSKKYNEKLVGYLKSIGSIWDPETKTWTIKGINLDELKNKINELNVASIVEIEEVEEGLEKEKPIKEGRIVMRLSKDKRFALLTINLLAFREDIESLLKGRRRTVRFRVLPFKRPKKT